MSLSEEHSHRMEQNIKENSQNHIHDKSKTVTN